MRFSSYSLRADRALEKLDRSTSTDVDPSTCLFREKLALCDYRVLLVAREGPLVERIKKGDYDPNTMEILHRAWQSVVKHRVDTVAQKKAWEIINKIGGVIRASHGKKSSSILRRFRDRSKNDDFFLLLTGYEPEGLPTYELLVLCNLWQLEQGHLPLHASGVISKNRLFLFMGPSGAGKSTVARMSLNENCAVLDEDQVLVHRLDSGRYSADAWGYNIKTCDAPLWAIFNLVQDSDDRLVPLPAPRLARFLMERNGEILGDMLSSDMLKGVFQQSAAIARCVPGFELHFRKSADFWDVIGERFPD